MTESNRPEINVEDLMRHIRREAARRKSQASASSECLPGAIPPGLSSNKAFRGSLTLPRTAEGNERLSPKESYTIKDFLDFHDEAFIRSAYLGILRREPDSSGLESYLSRLRGGELTKIEILGRLRFSREGRGYGVKVKGLLAPFVVRSLCRIPVLGYFIAFFTFLARLPMIVKNWERFEAFVLSQHGGHVRQTNALASRIESELRSLTDALALKVETEELGALGNRLEGALDSRADVLKADLESQLLSLRAAMDLKAGAEQLADLSKHLTSLMEEKSEKLESHLNGLAGALDLKADSGRADLQNVQQQLLDHKRHILDQSRRLSLLLEEARKRLPKPISEEQIENILSEEEHLLDAMYVSFEDRFRGIREEIKQRAEIYLPKVVEAGAGGEEAPILDIGCGRGEWLELLKERGLSARGIDLNRVMISECQELGLDVVEAEAVTYLRRLAPNSLGAVTGMHVIEHLPLRRLIAVFDEVVRVLKPGGVAIFETPNPENLVVGACNFYFDLTHQRPLPPESMRFLMEARGFVKVDVLRLHPYRIYDNAISDNPFVNALFAGSQDYSLIGRKA